MKKLDIDKIKTGTLVIARHKCFMQDFYAIIIKDGLEENPMLFDLEDKTYCDEGIDNYNIKLVDNKDVKFVIEPR